MIDDVSNVWLDREINPRFCQFLCACVQWLCACVLIDQIRFGKAIFAACVSSLLFVLLASTLGGSACGVIGCTYSLLFSNGSLGFCPTQAWHRDSKGPCPLPLPSTWSYQQVYMTKIKSLFQKRQTSPYPEHERLVIGIRWFHWNVFISLCTFKKKQLM